MLIIVEGCDCAGKSSFIEKKFPNYEVVSFSYPKTREERDAMYIMYATKIHDSKNRHIVWDRSFYSELVYGKNFRGTVSLSKQETKSLEVLVNNVGGMVFYLDPGADEIKRRLKLRGDDYITEADVTYIRNGYDVVLGNTTVPVYKVND